MAHKDCDFHALLQDGKLAKGTFLKQLRIIVGDEVLLSTINEIRSTK